MKNNLVTTDNRLIEASYTLSLPEKRLLLCYISKIHYEEKVTPDRMFTLDIREYSKMYGKEVKEGVREIKEALDRLYNRSIILKNYKDYESIEFRWITSKVVFLDTYKVGLRWSEDIIPFISQLTENFTKIRLRYTVNLHSFYHIKLYEWLICEINKGQKHKFYLSLPEVKFLFGIEENTYNQFGHLHDRVLKPAIASIGKETDLKVKLIIGKTGRKVTGVTFLVAKVKKEGYTM